MARVKVEFPCPETN